MDLAKPTTTPTRPKVHGARPPRGLDRTPSSPVNVGRFGRMFRNLPVFGQDEKDLVELAKAMIQKLEDPFDKKLGDQTPDEDENPEIPAGYTYLGQFIDHDLTFDPVSSLQRQNDPDALEDFRTPRFDLDSVYGRGPADQPYLYEADGLTFLLGDDVARESGFGGPDLPRNCPPGGQSRRALIGDPRNDENLIVSQLHTVFLRFHNAMLNRVRGEWEAMPSGKNFSNDDLFKETQRRVRWHYQWVVVHDFLPRILGGAIGNGKGRAIVDSLLDFAEIDTGITNKDGPIRLRRASPRLTLYDLSAPPFMPVEFSVAAYRFGHSMVRPSYHFNAFVSGLTESRDKPPFRTPIFSVEGGPLDNLNGFRPLPCDWGFEWRFFYEMPGRGEHLPQPSYKIDATLVNPLRLLPDRVAAKDPPFSLAERNLLRGQKLGLPSGESVALAMGIAPMTPEQLAIDADKMPSLVGNTPLWYYILKEAEVLCDSRHLGPVGGRIVAETFIGLLWGDPLSYLRVEPSWIPDLARQDGTFGMPELITFALGQPAVQAAA